MVAYKPRNYSKGHNYFEEVRTAIFSAYKSKIENQIKEQLKEQGQTVTDINLTEDDITQIKVTPYKISKNNSTKPDKHIDCTIDIVNNKVYTAKFWVMEPGTLKYEMKDSTTYLKENSVKETSEAKIGSTTTADGCDLCAQAGTKKILITQVLLTSQTLQQKNSSQHGTTRHR